MAPLLLALKTSEFVYNTLDKIFDKANSILPDGAVEVRVEFEKLPPRRQRQIEKMAAHMEVVKERMCNGRYDY